MAPRKKSTGRKSEPKLFRCTGFGDCDMVFTRSEHLARHARKHTGEKPYKCVVPECGRMFSRFDNMMQHTQTHNRSGKRKTSPKPAAKNRRKSTSAVNNDWSEDEYTDGFKKNRSHSTIHPTTQYSQWRSPSPPPASMMQSRTLPLPRRMSYSHSYYPPPLSKSPSLPDSPEEPPLTSFRSPSYYNMPPPPPLSSSTTSSSALFYRRGSLQSTSSTSSTLSSDSQSFRSSFEHGRRRLSAADLQAPIHSLKEENQEEQQLHPLAKSPPAVVDITSDEYEALQGFGKFSSQTHAQKNNNDNDEDDDDLVLPAIQPNKTNSPSLSAQVAAFRQKLMPIHESFQRPVKGNAI